MTTRPTSLGPLAEIVGFHLAQATVVAEEMFERHIGAPLDLRKAEFSLLMLLLANGPLAPKRLAQCLAMTAPSLTLLMARMEARKLLSRERHPTDGRSQQVAATPAGRKLAERSTSAALEMEQEMGTRLSAAEHAMLIELLRKAATRKPAA